jgi:light-regulated signal transduction histidine kinase (bacteriophytochrome)
LYIRTARVNLTSIFEHIDDACLVLNGTERVIFANEAAAKLIGRPRETLVGETLPDQTVVGLPLLQLVRNVTKSGSPLSARVMATETKQWFDLRATSAADNIVLFCFESETGPEPLVAGNDDQLARCLTHLHESNQELESLSYTVSHDIRAPLRHVEAFAGLLSQSLGGKLDASTTEYLSVITQSAQTMAGLLDGVLAYSRISRRDVNLTSVSLNDAINAVLQELKLEMEGRQVDIRLDALPRVQADPWMTREVFAQFLRNALKFTRGRSPAIIEITATSTPHEAILRIQDNGVGFNPEYTGKLFGLFQRLHTDPQFEGRGVGLALARRMIQRQGGRVWAEGKPDSGAAFFVALPKAE